MNENKKVNSIEICKLFGFPHTIIDGGASEEDKKQFISVVVSIVNRIETALDTVMLYEDEKEKGYYWSFDTRELTRGNMKERYEAYAIALEKHFLQIDEVRREEDYEPVGFNFVTMGLGDILLNPETMEVFTPNTGQTSNLLTGESRAEGIELRYNHNHDSKGRFASGSGGGGVANMTKLYSNGSAKPKEGVDKSGESGIIRESSKPKPITEITDKAIESVPKVNISGYTDEQCAMIQKQHKELLEYSREHNDNKEVAFVFDGSLESRKEFMGSDDKIDFGRGLYGSNITVLHNHPRNSSYSVTDIIFFGDNSNVKTLTIVKNNGKVEYLTKNEKFDSAVFKLEYDRLYRKIVKNGTDSEKDKFVKNLLNKSKSGVIWSERT